MNIKSEIAYWLSFPARWFHRKGFGVQSPWAFEFVTYVLYCDSHYYIFDELNGSKNDEQLFRITNWLKPHDIVINTDNTITKAYLVAPISKDKSKRSDDVIIHYYDSYHGENLLHDIGSGIFNNKSCVIVEGIRKENTMQWKKLIELSMVTSIFDIGHRGIAFFDPKRQKQTYYI